MPLRSRSMGFSDGPRSVSDFLAVSVMPSTLLHNGRARRDRIRIGSRFDEPETVSFWCGRTHWRALADVADELFDAAGLKGGDITACNPNEIRAEIVKSGPHRTVTRLQMPSGIFFVKHSRSTGWRGLLRSLVRPSKAFREMSAAECVAALGIATIDAVAVGETASPPFVTDDYLVTREIPDACHVLAFLEREAVHLAPRQQARIRRRLAKQLGELAARLHRGRLVHGDLLAENILVRADDDETLRLWLIDLQELQQQSQIGIRQIEGNLSALNNSLQWHATASDRLRFFRAYWRSLLKPATQMQSPPRSLTASEFREAARRVEAYCRKALRAATLHADAKWARGNRRLLIADGNGRRCRGLAWLGSEWLAAVRDDPERLFRDGRLLAVEGHLHCRRAAIDLPINGALVPCVVEAVPAASGWRRLSRSSWARDAWETGHRLLRRGIRTPRPLLFVETGAEEYLVTQRIAGAVSLAEHLCEDLAECTPPVREQALAACTRAVAEQLRKLHEQQFEHRDLTLKRLLVVPAREACEVVILDAHHVRRQRRRISRRKIVGRLAELHTAMDRIRSPARTRCLRFLKKYLGSRYGANWKQLWKDVARRIERRRKRSTTFPTTVLVTAALCGAAIAGCRTVDKPITLPARHSVRSEQLLVLSDFKLPRDHPLLADLNRLRQHVSETLALPYQTEEVVVYLFSTELAYTQYIDSAYPGLPHRRAYFVGTPKELAVYTFWGERIQEDLRHEYTHGLLHASIKSVPLWLDEGLAEYFEVPGDEPGTVNRDYSKRLSESLANGWRPDLKRLERIEEFSQMQRVDYEESWAWVHFMLHSSPETRHLLQRYLADHRENKQPQPLHQQLSREFGKYDSRFLAYLQDLGSKTQTLAKSE